MKKIALFLASACAISVIPSQLAAQTFSVTANIPFAFVVSGKTMPAGQYQINAGRGISGSLMVWNQEANTGVMAMAEAPVYAGRNENSAAILTFDHVGDQYFLAQVVPGPEQVGFDFNTSGEERQAGKQQSANKPEKVTVVAMR